MNFTLRTLSGVVTFWTQISKNCNLDRSPVEGVWEMMNDVNFCCFLLVVEERVPPNRHHHRKSFDIFRPERLTKVKVDFLVGLAGKVSGFFFVLW